MICNIQVKLHITDIIRRYESKFATEDKGGENLLRTGIYKNIRRYFCKAAQYPMERMIFLESLECNHFQ